MLCCQKEQWHSSPVKVRWRAFSSFTSNHSAYVIHVMYAEVENRVMDLAGAISQRIRATKKHE